MALKLPKQFHPDFSRPGVKPTGAVEIDWSNPLARGLKVCLLGSSQRATNLADQANPLTINGNVTHKALDGFVFGDTVSDYISDASTDYAQTGKFSAFLVVKAESSSGSLPTFIARGDASAGEWMFRHNNSGAVRFYANGGTWNTTSANLLSYGIKQTVGFTADTGSGLSVYVNGAVANTAGGSFLNASTKPLTVGAADGDSNRPYAGSMNLIIIYDRLLSDQEHAELNRDPYQILKPAVDFYLYAAQAAALVSSFLQLPKEFHPDFSRPGVKPTGRVEIDWDNPLAQGLSFASFCSGFEDRAILGDAPKASTGTKKVDGYEAIASQRLSYDNRGLNPSCGSLLMTFRRTSSPHLFGKFAVTTDAEFQLLRGASDTVLRLAINNNTASFTTPNLYDFEWHKIAVTWDETTNARTLYIDGAFIGTDSTAFTGGTLSTDLNFLNRADGSRPIAGLMSYGILYNRALSSSEIASLSRDPYQILRPAQPMMLFQSAGGGGAIYDVSVFFGLSAAVSDSGQAVAGASVTLSQEVGVSDSGNGSAMASTSLATQLGINISSAVAFNVDVSLSNGFGYNTNGQAIAKAVLTEGLTLEQSVSAIAQAVASVIFSQANNYAASTSGLTVDVTTNIGLTMDMSPIISVVLNGTVNLNSSLGAQANANANTFGSCDLPLQVGLHVAARALAEAGVVISGVTSITTTATSIIIGIVTPDNRSYVIEVDNRDFLILAENRDYEVK